MKYIKKYIDYNESLKTWFDELKIKRILTKFKIKNYTINPDGSIDVNGNVNISHKKLTKIPFKFGKVSGDFYCSYNQLTSLEGCPSEVGGNFNCSNNILTSLVGCPSEVGGYFSCHNNQLTSLEGCPLEVGRSFNCSDNQLTSLEGCPSEIGGDFGCFNNQFADLDISSIIKGNLYCGGNKIGKDYNFYGEVGGKIIFNRAHVSGVYPVYLT